MLITLSRGTLPFLAAASAFLVAACAPAAPSPTAPPPKPAATTAAPAKPAEKAAEKPARADWQVEWERVLAAARQEATVVVVGPPGDANRVAFTQAFTAAYPGIIVQYTGKDGREFAATLIAERDAGQYLTDVYMGGAETPRGQLKPKGALDPLRPGLILPEIMDDSKWLNGFNSGFMDKDQLIYAFQGQISWIVNVNRDVVPEAELSKMEQVLDPKWRAKFSWDDPRPNGPGAGDSGYINMVLGEDFLRRLLQHDPVVTADHRQQAEWLVRGTYPIAIGMQDQYLLPFRQQGLGQNIRPLEKDNEGARRLNPVAGTTALINRAPHPNAAKVYVNWLLSKEGQTAWGSTTEQNSRRLDVPGPSTTAPDPKQQYRIVNAEENQGFITRAQDIAKELIK